MYNIYNKKLTGRAPVLFINIFALASVTWIYLCYKLMNPHSLADQPENQPITHRKEAILNPVPNILNYQQQGTLDVIAAIFGQASAQPHSEYFKTLITYTKSSPETAIKILPIRLPETTDSGPKFPIPLDSELVIARESFNIPKVPLTEDEEKFFIEAKSYPSQVDSRFSRIQSEDATVARDYLKEILFVWASWCDEKEIPYWIAHTSLLGYKWSKQILPWENQIEIQIPANLLYDLEQYNGKKIDGDERYLFEINPHHKIRHHQDHNMIDARLIDVLNGHFIDISGISSKEFVSSPVETKEDMSKDADLKDHDLFAEYDLLIEASLREPEMSKKMFTKSGLMYDYEEIFPLIRTTFEGVPTWRPKNYTRILEVEFGSELIRNELHYQFKWDYSLYSWRLMNTCQELHKEYILPIVEHKRTVEEFPKYVWINLMRGSSTLRRCGISQINEGGSVVSFYGVWNNYEDLPSMPLQPVDEVKVSMRSRKFQNNKYIGLGP